jgi:hypothetical protein
MSDLLVTAFIADGSNAIFVSYSSDGTGWCETSVPQSSQASPALAVLNGDLWAAFRSADDSKIYSAGLSDWKANRYVGQNSDLAPAMASLGTVLWIAYIGQTNNHIELVSSGNGSSWAATITDTGQTSNLSPALTAWKTALWAAFQGDDTQIYVASSSSWGTRTSTGQSSEIAPALASFNGDLWVAYIGEATGNVELIRSADGSRWVNKIDTGQSSVFAPALTVFNGKLWVGYIGKATNHVELVSVDTAGHVSARIDTGQASRMAPALADIAAAAPPAKGLSGHYEYVYAAPQPETGQPGIPIQDLVVEIRITETIKVDPSSGLSSKMPNAEPIGFQINGFSPTSDDQTVGWQQYGVRMSPGTNTLVSFAELWPTAYSTNRKVPNLFQISSEHYNGSVVTLPDDLTIPKGWTIRFKFQQQGDGTITGFACTVTDEAGNEVGPALGLGINLLNNVPLAAGGTVAQGDLAPIVAFQVVLVGNWDSNVAVLVSGAGKITCSSSALMTPGGSWPRDASGKFGTAENTNSSYSLVPAQSSTSIAQTFGTAPGDIFGKSGYTLQMLVVTSSGEIMAGASTDGVHWWHGPQTPGFIKTGHTTQAAPSLVAVGSPGNPGSGNLYAAMLGQNNNHLRWLGSSDGVNWAGGSIGTEQSKFAPSLMMYYTTNNSGVGPWLGFVANDSSDELLVCSANFFGGPWSGSTPINQASKCSPAFTGWIDYYLMVFVANDSSNRLLACQTVANDQGVFVWSGPNDTGQSSPAAPSLAGARMAFISNDSSNDILVCSSTDGINWSGAVKTGHQSQIAPCMTHCAGLYFIAFVGLSGDVRLCSSGDGIHWSDSTPVEGLTSTVAPAIAGYDFQLTFSLSGIP